MVVKYAIFYIKDILISNMAFFVLAGHVYFRSKFSVDGFSQKKNGLQYQLYLPWGVPNKSIPVRVSFVYKIKVRYAVFL